MSVEKVMPEYLEGNDTFVTCRSIECKYNDGKGGCTEPAIELGRWGGECEGYYESLEDTPDVDAA